MRATCHCSACLDGTNVESTLFELNPIHCVPHVDRVYLSRQIQTGVFFIVPTKRLKSYYLPEGKEIRSEYLP